MDTDPTTMADGTHPIPTPSSYQAARRASLSDATSGAARVRHQPQSELLHVQLANVLREKILSREWPAGSRIMSEHALMERYGVSRGTARRAIGVLVGEGLLVQRKGKGTFVTEDGMAHPAGSRPLSFATSLHDMGLEFHTEVLCQEVLPAPDDVASELGLCAGDEAMFMRRVRSVEGRPVVCQESWSNLVACPGLEEADFTRESLFDAVERCSGHAVASSKMRTSAQMAGVEHGSYLGIDPASPVLVLEQTICLDDHVPIEWSLTWLRSDQRIVGVSFQDVGRAGASRTPGGATAGGQEAPAPAVRFHDAGTSRAAAMPDDLRRRLELEACDIRQFVVDTARRYPGTAFHIGGSLSCAEILATLYGGVMRTGRDGTPWDERDRFVLSKAHCSLALYPALLQAGLVSQEDVDRGLFGPDAVLFKHPRRDPARGLETSGGSLGMGLGYAAGLALALRRRGLPSRVFCLVGDGECNEGSTWESAAFIGHNALANLTLLVDANGMQLDGPTAEVLDVGSLARKFAAFGFECEEVDGQDVGQLYRALSARGTLPRAVIAHTRKGAGLSFAEGRVEWHDHELPRELWDQAQAELDARREAVLHG